MRRQVDELLHKSFIKKEFTSLYIVPALLTPKKDDNRWMYMDRCAINRITVKYGIFIYVLNNLLYMMILSYIFLKIDVCSWYHHIRIREDDKWKASFMVKSD